MSLLLLLVGAGDSGAPAVPEGGGFVGKPPLPIQVIPEEEPKDDEFWWWE